MPKVNTNVPAQWHDLVTDVRTAAQGPLYTLGQYREEDGKGYRYFQFDNGTAGLTLAANLLLYQVDNDMWILTSDVSDSDRNLVKGVAISVVGDLGYGWCQTAGSATVATNGDDDIAKGDAVIASAAGDGTCDSTAQDTAPICKVVGWATAADTDAANTVVVDLVLF